MGTTIIPSPISPWKSSPTQKIQTSQAGVPQAGAVDTRHSFQVVQLHLDMSWECQIYPDFTWCWKTCAKTNNKWTMTMEIGGIANLTQTFCWKKNVPSELLRYLVRFWGIPHQFMWRKNATVSVTQPVGSQLGVPNHMRIGHHERLQLLLTQRNKRCPGLSLTVWRTGRSMKQ